MKKLFTILLVCAMTGCGTLIPKRVEFFQDKVHQFPEQSASEREIQRQAAQRAEEKAREMLSEAYKELASPKVTEPGEEVVDLTGAVASSLGPPRHPSTKPSDELADSLRSAVAKLNTRIDEFRKENNENTGKKIEGTGLFSVPYFLWIAIVGVLFFVGLLIAGVLWTFFKMFAASNPPVQLGLGAVQLGAGFLKRAVGEVAKGGEAFKDALMKKVSDPKLQEELKELFRIEHERSQSADTQALLKEITKKE